MGASALHHLVGLGCKDPVLVERDTLAAGSTGHCAGGVRTLFSDELNVRIGVESIARLQRFEAEVGQPLDLRLFGYLFLLDDPDHVARFERDLTLQEKLGLGTRLLGPGEARAFVAQLETEGLVACVWCPQAGYLTPDLVVQGYARRAAEGGAHVVQSCPAVRILVENGCVAGVETARGTIRTERVILAAGVWSRELAATAGLDLPVTRERRFMFFTEEAPGWSRELPLTVDFSTGFYFHTEGDGIAFGGREASLEELAPVAALRLPALADLGVRSSFWGYYELSPDHNALVGSASAPAGLIYATGFSGHGFQQGPVIGEHLAELALDRSPTFDLAPFSVERFGGDGGVRLELNVV